MKYIVTSKDKLGTESKTKLKCLWCQNDEFEQYTQLVVNTSPPINASNIETHVDQKGVNRSFVYKCSNCSFLMLFEMNLDMLT